MLGGVSSCCDVFLLRRRVDGVSVVLLECLLAGAPCCWMCVLLLKSILAEAFPWSNVSVHSNMIFDAPLVFTTTSCFDWLLSNQRAGSTDVKHMQIHIISLFVLRTS
jgi:hypothetical protein